MLYAQETGSDGASYYDEALYAELEEDYEGELISDPLEPFNRAMFYFNDKLYFYLFKPVAQGYSFVVPEVAREKISNGFYNLRFPIRFVNDLLQAKFKYAGVELGRFVVNMRDTGLRLSRERYVKELRNLEDRLVLVKEWLYDKAGEEFKLQMRSFDKIFSKLGMNLPPLKTPGGKVSWSKEALELLPENEFITKLIEGRHIENVLGSQKDVK